jgi:hypothetical protein
MTVSVHVAADQMAQLWDGYVCRRSKKLRSIPPISRYYLALCVLAKSGVLTRTISERDENESFDLPDNVHETLKKPILGQSRRVLDDIEDISTRKMAQYIRAINNCMERVKAGQECWDPVRAVADMIVDGEIEVIGWDAEGLLEVRATEQGAQQMGMPQGEVFRLFSAMEDQT